MTFAPPDTCRGISPKRLGAKIREIPMRIDRQVRAYEAGIISLDELKFARNRLRAEEEGLRTQLAHIQAERAQRPDMQAFTARLDEALQKRKSPGNIPGPMASIAISPYSPLDNPGAVTHEATAWANTEL